MTLRTFNSSFSMANAVASPRATSVPPAFTKALRASTPSSVDGASVLGGIDGGRPVRVGPLVVPIIVSVWSWGRMMTSYFDRRFSCVDLRVPDRAVGEIEGLQSQASPSLVHVAAPVALVHGGPHLLDLVVGGRAGRQRREVHAGGGGDPLQRRHGRRRRTTKSPGRKPGDASSTRWTAMPSARSRLTALKLSLSLPSRRWPDSLGSTVPLRGTWAVSSTSSASIAASIGIHPDAHELGHGVGRGVIGPERSAVAAPGPLVVGVERAAEQVSDEAHLGLGQRNHVGTCTVRHVAHREGLARLEDLDVGQQERVDHLRCGQRVVLVAGNDVGLWESRRLRAPAAACS